MGAKQSKRSVDISGKEAEGGGEVAVAGAGGEGRVEQLADADALKPQINGDAHIQHEQTDKEKELDSGTPENEKDATTEKEGKGEEQKEMEAAPVTNGESEPKVENGESTPTPEDGKKPKKEKVKKKWSLRSISFSRKDKPKQEKKQKDEEPKTNGEPEKVPEETAEATPEAAVNEVAEEATALAEEKAEKTPETPVTEPLTNGTSTPESAAPQTPDTPLEHSPEPQPQPQPEPEQLPVNGLSLQEPKPEIPEVDKPEETKPESPAAETVETVPAPEIPKEVCVEQVPLLEPTPPPLPANPPPSSVASFAATTMAPELTDASLANTAAAAIATPLALPDTKDNLVQPDPPAVTTTETLGNELPSILKETSEDTPAVTANDESEIKNVLEANIVNDVILPTQITPDIDNAIVKESPELVNETVVVECSETANETAPAGTTEVEAVDKKPIEIETAKIETHEVIAERIETSENVCIKTPEIESVNTETSEIKPLSETIITETETVEIEEVSNKAEAVSQSITEAVVTESKYKSENIPESEVDSVEDDFSLPPPPAQDELETNLDDVDEKVVESLQQIPEPITETEKIVAESNHISNSESGERDVSADEITDAELKKKAMAATVETIECNGEPDVPAPAAPVLTPAAPVLAPAAPVLAPAAPVLAPAGPEEAYLQNGDASSPHTPQEPIPVSDKLADLIPELPDVPELKTETLQETVTDLAVGN